MTSIWKSIPTGTIVDSDIHALAAAGELIVGEFEPTQVRQGCYELRAGTVFYETWSTKEDKRIQLGPNDSYVLRPHTYVTVIVLESLRLPDMVIGRILTKGRLFSVGILPVNTYADPGFEGRLGLTLCNMSHRHLKIRPGEPLAKIEFARLEKSVEHPYAGQHGYQTEIWPIPTHLFASNQEIQADSRTQSADSELELSYGPAVASLERRLQFYERIVWLQIAITVTAFCLIYVVVGSVGLVGSLMVGVVANLVTTLGVNVVGLRRRKR